MGDTDNLTTRVPDGDFIVADRDMGWIVRRVVGDGASQTTWIIKAGEDAAVAQALIFARHDRTAAWLRVDERQYRLIETFRTQVMGFFKTSDGALHNARIAGSCPPHRALGTILLIAALIGQFYAIGR